MRLSFQEGELEVWIWEGGSRGGRSPQSRSYSMLQRDVRVLPCSLKDFSKTHVPKSNKIANFTVFHNILNKHEQHAFLFLASNINLPVAGLIPRVCTHWVNTGEIVMPDLPSLPQVREHDKFFS